MLQTGPCVPSDGAIVQLHAHPDIFFCDLLKMLIILLSKV